MASAFPVVQAWALTRLLSLSPSSVTPMSSSQVRTSDAYLLFYELASPPSRM